MLCCRNSFIYDDFSFRDWVSDGIAYFSSLSKNVILLPSSSLVRAQELGNRIAAVSFFAFLTKFFNTKVPICQ